MQWWEYVLSAGIPAAGAVFVAWIGIRPQLMRIKASTDSVEYAITNNHDLHLRDDLDAKFHGVDVQVKGVSSRVASVEVSLEGLSKKVDQAIDLIIQSNRQVNSVETRFDTHLQEDAEAKATVSEKLDRVLERI